MINSMISIIDGFGFTAYRRPLDVHDAIIVKSHGLSDCEAPQYYVPYHSVDEYVDYINRHKIEKAIIILNDISFITRCPTLKYLNIIPSYQAADGFDFSPLYSMPEIKSISCQNIYGISEKYSGEIDYSLIKGLIDLTVFVNPKSGGYNKIQGLKTLRVSGFKEKKHDLTDLICCSELDSLSLHKCSVVSLNGIEMSKEITCLDLSYCKTLSNIEALKGVSKTLKALTIDSCAKISNFSVFNELGEIEVLVLRGNNTLPNLQFLESMKNLKLFICEMNVKDGDLRYCMNIPYAYVKDRRHYNIKDEDLPKDRGYSVTAYDKIEVWRRLD